MEERGFVESFNAAIEGIIYVLKTERNMRIHFLAAFFLLVLGIYLNFDAKEIMILTITIALVLLVEMINTTIELTLDIVEKEFHPMIKLIKDISAGAVLLSAINAAIVGYILFLKRLPFSITHEMTRIRSSPWHITFIAIIVVFGLAILGKVVFHKGKPLRGGMPSGHAAVAFAMWTIICFMTKNTIVITLSFAMAFLIARHRIKSSIHNIWEVIAGSVLGVLVTTLIFQLLG